MRQRVTGLSKGAAGIALTAQRAAQLQAPERNVIRGETGAGKLPHTRNPETGSASCSKGRGEAAVGKTEGVPMNDSLSWSMILIWEMVTCSRIKISNLPSSCDVLLYLAVVQRKQTENAVRWRPEPALLESRGKASSPCQTRIAAAAAGEIPQRGPAQQTGMARQGTNTIERTQRQGTTTRTFAALGAFGVLLVQVVDVVLHAPQPRLIETEDNASAAARLGRKRQEVRG